MYTPILDFGVNLIIFLQSLGDWLIAPMRLFSFLSSPDFVLILMPFLYWSVDAGIGIRVGVILLLSDGLNNILKLAFHSPRPFYYTSTVRALAVDTSFGAPSNHAQTGAAFWGLLAALSYRRWPERRTLILVLILLLIFLIGLSRVYLGVHFPTDVLLGWVIGLILVWAFLKLEAPVSARLRAMSLGSSILLVFGISFMIILLAFLTWVSLGDWQVPQSWIDNAAIALTSIELNPMALSSIFTSTGAFFGLGAGVLWLSTKGGFSASGTIWKRLARYPIGVIGVLVLYLGLGAIFPRGEALLPYLLRFLRYALIGLWISALAPLLFIRLGLAVTSSQPGVSKSQTETQKAGA